MVVKIAKKAEKAEKPEKKSEISVSKLRADADAKAEKKAEKKVEPKVEAKAEKKAKVEPKVEKKVEAKVEKKVEAKAEVKVEKKAEKKVEAKAEKKVEAKVEKKAKETLPAVKATVVKAEVVSVKKHLPGEPIDPVIEDVRRTYRNFAQTWLEFALKIKNVSDSEAWKSYADTWSEFCTTEFPDLGLGTISKFLRVASDWGKALTELRERKPDALLPAYEACYELSVHADKVPEDELPKLRKALLENKMTRPELTRRLEPYRKPRVTRTHTFDRAETKRIEKEIEAEVETTTTKVDDPAMSRKIDKELSSDIDETAHKMIDKVKHLIDHLPILTSVVEKTTFNVVKLAEEAEKLQSLIEDYLTKIEKISA